jgi:hypothetical protein
MRWYSWEAKKKNMKPYGIDPTQISLEEFRELTASRRMLPSRLMLQEQMDRRFGVLHRHGMEHVGDLLKTLGSKSKIEDFSRLSGLSMDYLVLLKREAGSYLARPFALSEFPGIPFEYIELLKSRGIKTTRDFYEKLQTRQEQSEFSAASGIPSYRLMEIFTLCELSRITGVGGVFARILYEAGIRSTEDFASMDPAVLLERCRQVIEKHGYEAGKLGEKDMQYGISYAKVLVACDRKAEKL